MSAGTTINPLPLPLIVGKMRAYFAPVNAQSPAPFDSSLLNAWQIDAPPAPWVDLGRLATFTRFSDSQTLNVESGSPATVQLQAKQSIGARVRCRFERWNRLTMALTASSDTRNILKSGFTPLSIGSGSSSTILYLPSSAGISIGAFLAVDNDYSGQTGFIGAGSAGGYVQNATAITGDVDYIRRCSWNIAQVSSIRDDGGLLLASRLLGGSPTATMKAQLIMGFGDREGGTFTPEWSGLFLANGTQGEKLFFYYPRLQSMTGVGQAEEPLGGQLQTCLLDGTFRALPIADKTDGSATVCYRGFLPSAAFQI